MSGPAPPLRVLLELRPALDGHAGIPQETRLLFRALHRMSGVEATGLIQSDGHVLETALPSLPARRARLAPHRQVNRLSRVVISIERPLKNPYVVSTWMAVRQLAGARETLYEFDPSNFRDFLWRRFFARTLLAADIDEVTSARFRTLCVPWKGMHGVALATRRVGHALFPRLDTRDFDVMIAETPYPGRVSRNTRLLVRYHDAIPVLMPDTISEQVVHQARHYHALRRNVADGAWFACVSESTRKDLLGIFPEAEARTFTVPNMISEHYFPPKAAEPCGPVGEIVRNRRNVEIGGNSGAVHDDWLQGVPPKYLLMVSTLEPRKNHLTLVSAWETLRASAFPGLKLVLVGMLGWRHKPIVRKLKPWIDRGEISLLEDVPASELRQLYRQAAVTVCPSLGEGFDFSGVEAMRCGSAVVASEIPVHREIYAEAAEYFNPYSIGDLAAAIANVIGDDGRALRDRLVEKGAEQSARYVPDRILPSWMNLLHDHLARSLGKRHLGEVALART